MFHLSARRGARLALALALLVAALLMLPPRPPADDQDLRAEGSPWPAAFNVITPPVGTAGHSLALAWVSEFNAVTGSRVRVLPAPNGYARAAWLASGEGRIALSQASDYHDRMDARDGYAAPPAGPFDSRVLNVALVSPWGYMVRGDSALESIADVRPGVRLAYYAGTPTLAAGIDALLALTGLSREDVRLIEVGSYAANTRAVVEGRADIAFTSPLSGPSYEAEAEPAGIRWLALPASHPNLARYRGVQAGYLPRRTTAGVASAHGILMDHAYQTYHVRADEDERFVAALLQWLDANHARYAPRFAHAGMMSLGNLTAYLEAGALEPLHAATIRHLAARGLWRPAWQARQDRLAALAQRRLALYHKALDLAARRGIRPEPGSMAWRTLWRALRRREGEDASYAVLTTEAP